MSEVKVERRHRDFIANMFTLAPLLESPVARWARGEPARSAFEREVQYPQWTFAAEKLAAHESRAEARGYAKGLADVAAGLRSEAAAADGHDAVAGGFYRDAARSVEVGAYIGASDSKEGS